MTLSGAVTNLFASLYELANSVVHAVWAVISTAVMTVVNLFTGALAFVGSVFQGMVDVAGGLGKFVTGNIVTLALIAAAGYAYIRFTAQGRQLAQQNGVAVNKLPPTSAGAGKKTN